MWKSLQALVMLSALPSGLFAESWSLGAGTGPFIFGHFAERTTPIATETGSATITSHLSAATRAGATVDLEREVNDRWALRLEGDWTRAPMRVKSGGGQGVTFDAGTVNLTTLVAPVVLRINPHGALRFHLMAGPAYAFYTVHNRGGGGQTFSLFNGTRGRWGGAAGGGVEWWWSRRFAVEWEAQDIVTGSPFRPDDIAPSPKGVHIPRPQNGHTTIGIRYRF